MSRALSYEEVRREVRKLLGPHADITRLGKRVKNAGTIRLSPVVPFPVRISVAGKVVAMGLSYAEALSDLKKRIASSKKSL